jgi:hypothetical protein
MPRQGNRLKRATGAIAKTAKKLTSKLHLRRHTDDSGDAAPPSTASTTSAAASRPRSAGFRPQQRPTDIPLDVVTNAYTPKQTSMKTSFRFDGTERQRDQELGRGVHVERYSDEDHFTNKSGDARIGTHGRSYEPGEQRARK